jgi:hypothetical protein
MRKSGDGVEKLDVKDDCGLNLLGYTKNIPLKVYPHTHRKRILKKSNF